MHIVFVGAHPDDETFCSGTLAKHARNGHKITILVATRGGMGHWEFPSERLKKIRSEEMRRAAKILGAEVRFLGFQDADVEYKPLKEALIDVFRKLKPDIIVTFHPLDWRDDHRNTGLAAHDAAFKASLPLVKTKFPFIRRPDVYFMAGPGIVDLEPDICIDIEGFLDLRTKAVMEHKSQAWFFGETKEAIKKRLETMARDAAATSDLKYAEAFKRSGLYARRGIPPKKATDFFPCR